jgi:uncharacterized membrane protein SpoIIM required for sporulation
MIKNLREELRPVWLIAGRELRDQVRDWRIILPVIGLTVFFPFLMNFTAKAALNFATKYGTPLIGERFVPFLLMVVGFFPITVSLVIALEAFVGEKERGTIEPLLTSPLKDWQLYLGKLTAAVSAPLVTAYLGITVYLLGLVANGVPLPDLNRLAQTIVLTSVQAVLMVSAAIVISTQATSVRAANLMSSFVVIPVAMLIQGESILLFWGTNQILWLAVIAVASLSALLVRVGVAHFQREVLLGREIDILNLRWMGITFWRAFRGEARNIFEWYRREVPATLRRQSISIWLTVLIGVGAAVAIYFWSVFLFRGMTGLVTPQDVTNALGAGLNPLKGQVSFWFIFGNNIRALFIIAVLGLVSFGTLGILAYVLNASLIGGVLGAFKTFGYSPLLLLLTGILPHGIFELPALILSTAAVLHVGVMIVTPEARKTLGETLIVGIADWAKINLGLVIPLLAIAAAIETWITPVLLLSTLK